MTNKSKQVSIKDWLTSFTLTLIYVLVLDIIWIVTTAAPLYGARYGSLLDLKIPPAVGFYSLFAIGLHHFTILGVRVLTRQVIYDAGLFGLCVYGGYALTVLAVFNFYETSVACLEMLWGMSISIMVAAAVIKTKNAINNQ